MICQFGSSEQQPQPRAVTTPSRKSNATTTGTSRSQPSHCSATNGTQNRRAVSAGKGTQHRHRENSGGSAASSSEKGTRHSSGGNTIPKRPTSTPAAPRRRCFFGDGDSGSGGSGRHSNTKVNRRLLNEPIARCIAGYVDKYMNVRGAKVIKTYQT